jgi:hypothetical protein
VEVERVGLGGELQIVGKLDGVDAVRSQMAADQVPLGGRMRRIVNDVFPTAT